MPDLSRFVEAQAPVYVHALAELLNGRKTSHWMWFVFPQIAGLGRSETARFYAIRDVGEAQAYLAHPLLGPRLANARKRWWPLGGQAFGKGDLRWNRCDQIPLVAHLVRGGG